MRKGFSLSAAVQEMIAGLVKGQEAVVRTARKIFPAVEEASGEPAVAAKVSAMDVTPPRAN